MSKRAVVFDLDGTLIDSYRDIAAALNAVLAALGKATHDPERVKTMIGGGVDTLLRRGLGEDDPQLLAQGRARFRDEYGRRLLETTRCYEGALEAIESLQRAGRTLVVATNKPSFFTRRIADELGLLRAGIRSLASADEAKKKPDPSLFRLALDRSGREFRTDEVVAVGDMPVDVETARAFGCAIAGVAWGFDPGGMPRADLDEWVETPRDLAQALLDLG